MESMLSNIIDVSDVTQAPNSELSATQPTPAQPLTAAQRRAEAQELLKKLDAQMAEAKAELKAVEKEADAELRARIEKLLKDAGRRWDELFAPEIKAALRKAIDDTGADAKPPKTQTPATPTTPRKRSSGSGTK